MQGHSAKQHGTSDQEGGSQDVMATKEGMSVVLYKAEKSAEQKVKKLGALLLTFFLR